MIPKRCSGPVDRREFLRGGGLVLGGLGLAEVTAARAAARTTADTSVILVYCLGGPSHLETYDLKDADAGSLARRGDASSGPQFQACRRDAVPREPLPHGVVRTLSAAYTASSSAAPRKANG